MDWLDFGAETPGGWLTPLETMIMQEDLERQEEEEFWDSINEDDME